MSVKDRRILSRDAPLAPRPGIVFIFRHPAPAPALAQRRAIMHSYCICGFSVASDIELPGSIAAGAAAQPDITIRRGHVPHRLDGATRVGPNWEMSQTQFLMSIPDIARFVLNEGREIVFAAESPAREADVPIFVEATMLGILLHQREQIVLRASAISVDGKAVLFCGPTGAGKSTIAAALVQRGYPLLADDLCAIAIDAGGVPVAHPDGDRLKLWAQAVDRLELAHQRGAPLRQGLNYFYVAPRDAVAHALPLGAVYILREARPPHGAGIDSPNVVEARLLLRRNAYRPPLVQRMTQDAIWFRAGAAVADVAGPFFLTRFVDFARMPEVIAMLEKHWRDSGLTGADAARSTLSPAVPTA